MCQQDLAEVHGWKTLPKTQSVPQSELWCCTEPLPPSLPLKMCNLSDFFNGEKMQQRPKKSFVVFSAREMTSPVVFELPGEGR